MRLHSSRIPTTYPGLHVNAPILASEAPMRIEGVAGSLCAYKFKSSIPRTCWPDSEDVSCCEPICTTFGARSFSLVETTEELSNLADAILDYALSLAQRDFRQSLRLATQDR